MDILKAKRCYYFHETRAESLKQASKHSENEKVFQKVDKR